MNLQKKIFLKHLKRKTMATTKRQGSKENSPMKVIGGLARVSYAHVFKPTSVHPDKPETLKYSAVLLIPKTNKELIKTIKVAINAAIEAGVESKWNNKKPNNLNLPLRDGDNEDKPEYAGHYFLSVKSDTKPGIVDKDREPLTSEDEFYSGCYVRFSIKFFPYNTAGNKGVGVNLNHLQKVKDGERLGGRASVDEDFSEDWNDEDDDNLLDD